MSEPKIPAPKTSVLVAGTLVALTGCAIHAPLAPMPTADQAAASLEYREVTAGAPVAEWPRQDWWTKLGDPQLDRLVAEALAGSPDMESAVARLRQAEARAAVTRAPLIPSVEGSAGATRSRFSENGIFPPPIGGSTVWQNKVSLDFAWEIDFWGKQRSALTGALRDVDAAKLDRELAELSLSAAVTRRYIEWQRLERQLEIGRSLIRQREGLLDLARKRVDAGLDSNVQLRAAEAAVPDIRADVSSLETQALLARIELAALLGAGPDRALTLTAPAVRELAITGLPTLLPADLLARRTDVRASILRAEGAAARADAAQADFYPNINLAAQIGLDSQTFDDWLEDGSRFFNVGPALKLPLFGGGRRRATLGLRTAEYDEAVAAYRSTLLSAVRDVAVSLVEMQSIDGESRDAQAAVDAQQQSYDLARRRFEGGLGAYTEVLLAESTLLNQQRRIADLEARRLDASVRLVAALGGGLPVDQ